MQCGLKDAKAARIFAIHPALQSAGSINVGDIVNLQLFENDIYTATVSNIVTDVNGTLALTLKLPDYPMAIAIITTSTEGKSLVTINIPELNKNFVSRGSIYSETSYLIEIDKSKVVIALCNDEVVPDESAKNTSQKITIQESNYMPDANLGETDAAQIDLLIVYTPAAAQWAATNEGGVANTIAGAMAQTKAVVDNQGNGDVINLVHSQQINYTEFAGDAMSTDLDRLTGISDGFMDEVHLLRKQYNADIVALFELNDEMGGLGWILSNTNGQYNNAFNVVRIQQASNTITSIHEIGHNLGMIHNIEEYDADHQRALFPYAFGWHWTGNDNKEYGSVMSYIGNRIPYFSNPNINYMGQPTGTATANNAKVFRQTKHVVANYSNLINSIIITASAGSNGCILPSGEVSVVSGDSKTFTFIPDAGYKINQVLVDDVNNTSAVSAGSYTFENVTANHTIHVTFTQQSTCKTPPEYDEILPPPTNSWENRSVSLQPNSCYVFRVSVTRLAENIEA